MCCGVVATQSRRFWATISRQPPHHTNTPLSTRSGCESIAHMLQVQGLIDLDPQATVLSVYGVGAFDLISRATKRTHLCESLRFLHFVAKAKVRDEPEEFRDLVKRAWMTRLSSLLACTTAKSSCFFFVGAQMCSRLRWRGRSGP